MEMTVPPIAQKIRGLLQPPCYYTVYYLVILLMFRNMSMDVQMSVPMAATFTKMKYFSMAYPFTLFWYFCGLPV